MQFFFKRCEIVHDFVPKSHAETRHGRAGLSLPTVIPNTSYDDIPARFADDETARFVVSKKMYKFVGNLNDKFINVLLDMAIKFSLFKTPAHKNFDYVPRYWNPEKEEREERIKRIKAELGDKDSDGKPYVSNFRNRFREELDRNRKAKHRPKTGMNRVFVIALILLAMLFAVYFLNMNQPSGEKNVIRQEIVTEE